MPLEPDTLEAYPDVVEQLAAFEFFAESPPRDPFVYTIDGGIAYRVIGRDSCADQFVLLADGRILYATSEGQAGVIAADFVSFLKLIIAVPDWRDVLKFSGNGQLSEMRRAAIVFAKYAIYDEARKKAGAFIRSELSLDEPDDPVGALYHAVSESGLMIRLYGTICMSLFNSGIIDTNHPIWRGLDD